MEYHCADRTGEPALDFKVEDVIKGYELYGENDAIQISGDATARHNAHMKGNK